MTERSIVHRFTAGEISPAFYGGTDLEKYGSGLAKIENGIVDFKGGVKNRSGFEFMSYLLPNTVIAQFATGGNTSDYLLAFSGDRTYLLQDGQYVLNPASVYTVNSVSGDAITFPSPPLITDDLLFLSGVGNWPNGMYRVISKLGSTWRVEKMNGDALSDPGYTSGGTATAPIYNSRAFTLAELPQLRFKQIREKLLVTCPTRTPVYFEITSGGLLSSFELRTAPLCAAPTHSGINFIPSHSGVACMVYYVTAVDKEGRETGNVRPRRLNTSRDFTAVAGSVTIFWPIVPGAVSYRIYRSLVTEDANLDTAVEVGFIGETFSQVFVDANIIPDYTRQPPQIVYPFDSGAVLSLTLTAGGSGYSANDVPIITATSVTGADFFGYGVVGSGGGLVGVKVVRPGRNYLPTDPITVSGGTGTGAVVTLGELSPTTGIYPSVSETFQQRQIFAGMDSFPLRLWGSRSGTLDDFSIKPSPVLSDAFSLDIDAEEITPIRHLVKQTNGLLIMHSRGVDKLVAAQGEAVGPGNFSVRAEVAIGVGATPPITINNDVLFVTDAGTSLIALAYTFYSNSYAPQDLSVLSGHLFPRTNPPVQLAWQEEPNRLLWARREDGTLLTLTYLREQEIYGWARHNTRGYFRNIVSAREGTSTKLYAVVDRWLQGRWQRLLERLTDREETGLEQFFGVDCGLRADNTIFQGAVELTYDAVGDDTFVEAAGTPFGSVSVGDAVFAWGGRFEVLEVVSTARLRVLQIDQPTGYLPGTTQLLGTSDWSVARPFATFSGLDHLEGETVSVLADGDAILNVPVVDGAITLDAPAVIVSAGLPYTTEIDTLPLATYSRDPSDGRRKRPAQVALRLQDTRGLQVGSRTGPLYEMKDRSFEAYGEVTRLRSGVSLVSVGALWEQDAQLRFRQTHPLPMTILGFVAESELEDA